MPSDKKNEILNAAASCFARFGYEKTTMDDVGEIVGMNKVSLYYYFKNKEALFKEMLLRESADYTERTKLKIAEIEDSKGKIIAWIEASFRYGQDSSILRQFSMETLKRLSPLMAEFKESASNAGIAFTSSVLKQGIARGEFKKCEAARVAESIVHLIYALKDAAYKKHAANPGVDMDIDGLIKEVRLAVGLMLDGLSVRR
jgi:AcrR family transcriptional regulator